MLTPLATKKDFYIIKQILLNNNRYKHFIMLTNPRPFNELFKDINIELVQLHSIELTTDKKTIFGFSGICRWHNNKIESLDHDSYTDKMLVYGFEWFNFNKENKNLKGLDILVLEW